MVQWDINHIAVSKFEVSALQTIKLQRQTRACQASFFKKSLSVVYTRDIKYNEIYTHYTYTTIIYILVMYAWIIYMQRQTRAGNQVLAVILLPEVHFLGTCVIGALKYNFSMDPCTHHLMMHVTGNQPYLLDMENPHCGTCPSFFACFYILPVYWLH